MLRYLGDPSEHNTPTQGRGWQGVEWQSRRRLLHFSAVVLVKQVDTCTCER